jgi:hypothetical protein
MKVYQKRGALNYKEKRMVTAIEKALSEKIAKQPELANQFDPARNFDELKSLFDEYCVTDTEFVDIPNNEKVGNQQETETTHEEFRKGMEDTIQKPKPEQPTETKTFIDPFNDAEPIVRDYVQSGGLKEEGEQQSTQTEFAEPTTQQGAFEMPTDDDEKGASGKTIKGKKPEPSKPINPKFDDMSDSKKKRSTKRFAKIIIEGVCLLAEKGCIWWTTKNITEDKLAQYEIDGEMDLQILLTLDDGQQATVREWFAQKVNDAQTLFKVSETDKSDLIDSLYEVMLEKGVAPTPMQELIINAVKTFVLDMGLKALGLSSQINNVLGQLKLMKANTMEANFEEDVNFENPATEQEEQQVTETGLTTT